MSNKLETTTPLLLNDIDDPLSPFTDKWGVCVHDSRGNQQKGIAYVASDLPSLFNVSKLIDGMILTLPTAHYATMPDPVKRLFQTKVSHKEQEENNKDFSGKNEKPTFVLKFGEVAHVKFWLIERQIG
jgi:hypothetical protein